MPFPRILPIAGLRSAASGRRLPLVALALVAAEALLRALGGGSLALTFAVLVLAPGLALTPLLPAAVRRVPLATVAAAPALGFAATSVLLISMSRVGIPLEAWPARAAIAALCLLGLAWRAGEASTRTTLGEAAALAGALAVGVLLQWRVIGEVPVPGNDWAKYLLYAEEIRRQGSLLIDNPYWMLGMPFREDPATPAVYAAALEMSGAPAGALVHGVWLFATMGVLAVFALVRSAWGPVAGCLAAALYAVLPVNQNILGWHGLANVAAFAVLALVLTFVVDVLRRREAPEPTPWAQHAGLGLALVALPATHALTTAVGVAALVPVALIALLASPARERRRLAVAGGSAAVAFLVLGALVLSDLLIRRRTFGGTQDFTAYLSTKVNLGLTLRDLSIPFAIAAAVALGAFLVRLRADRRLWPFFALCVAAVLLAYSWVVAFPLSYLRMVYFLPLALVPLVAVGLAGIRRGAIAGAVLAVVVAGLAWVQGPNVREFYAFSDRASLRGLDVVAARLRPGEVVVTDRCWSFLATWLLQTRTLPALASADIGPAAEVPFARQGRAILQGSEAGRERARRLGVRFILVDPTCVGVDGRAIPPPVVGDVVYLSRRLAVLELGAAP